MSDHLGLLVVPLADGDGVYLAAPEPEVSPPAAEPAAPAFLAVGEDACVAPCKRCSSAAGPGRGRPKPT